MENMDEQIQQFKREIKMTRQLMKLQAANAKREEKITRKKVQKEERLTLEQIQKQNQEVEKIMAAKAEADFKLWEKEQLKKTTLRKKMKEFIRDLKAEENEADQLKLFREFFHLNITELNF